MVKQIYYILQKDFKTEWRQGFTLGGLLLYTLTSVFIIYFCFIEIKPESWNALYWILFLFIAVNTTLNSFSQQKSQYHLRNYNLYDPISVFVSKVLFNFSLLQIFALFSLGVFSLLLSNPLINLSGFILLTCTVSLSFSIVFTFISAISSQSNGNVTLLTILTFPITIPILLECIKISAQYLGVIVDTDLQSDYLIILAIDFILFALGIIFFPILWKD